MPAAPIAVQLYSLRTEMAADPEDVLRTVAAIGYAGVETAGLHGVAPDRFKAVLDDCGLGVASAHVPLPVGAAATTVLDEVEAIGATTVVASGGRDDFGDLDGVRRTADAFNEAAATAAARGLTVGYHNHWWELAGLPDGRCAYDVLVEHLDPAVVLEIDLYWVRVGGADPAAVVTAAGARARLLHVKDGPLDPPSPMTACGDGAMDLATPIAAAVHADWHVVELDACATDMVEAVRRSHDHLVGAGLSSGRS